MVLPFTTVDGRLDLLNCVLRVFESHVVISPSLYCITWKQIYCHIIRQYFQNFSFHQNRFLQSWILETFLRHTCCIRKWSAPSPHAQRLVISRYASWREATRWHHLFQIAARNGIVSQFYMGNFRCFFMVVKLKSLMHYISFCQPEHFLVTYFNTLPVWRI